MTLCYDVYDFKIPTPFYGLTHIVLQLFERASSIIASIGMLFVRILHSVSILSFYSFSSFAFCPIDFSAIVG